MASPSSNPQNGPPTLPQGYVDALPTLQTVTANIGVELPAVRIEALEIFHRISDVVPGAFHCRWVGGRNLVEPHGPAISEAQYLVRYAEASRYNAFRDRFAAHYAETIDEELRQHFHPSLPFSHYLMPRPLGLVTVYNRPHRRRHVCGFVVRVDNPTRTLQQELWLAGSRTVTLGHATKALWCHQMAVALLHVRRSVAPGFVATKGSFIVSRGVHVRLRNWWERPVYPSALRLPQQQDPDKEKLAVFLLGRIMEDVFKVNGPEWREMIRQGWAEKKEERIDFIARCVSMDPRDRPSLPEVRDFWNAQSSWHQVDEEISDDEA